MQWSPDRASDWLKKYADEVAGDSYKCDGDEVLYACAGAAYYAVLHGVGYNTKEEFENFFQQHMGLDQEFLDLALSEIENTQTRSN